MRNQILKSPLTKIPADVKLEDVIKGEIEIPCLVRTFYENLVTPGGRHKDNGISRGNERRSESLSYDTIYAVSKGRIKTSKHILLGLVMRTLTGSRKALEVLNRLNHCISYHAAEELDTEMVFTSAARKRLLPDGLHLAPDLNTGVAFDNLDRFCATLTGTDTLHDTVGIVYQNVPSDNQLVNLQQLSLNAQEEEDSAATPGNRRRRSFEPTLFEIPPYQKCIKLVTESLVELDDGRRGIIATSFETAKLLDFVWLLHFPDRGVPMWFGFMSKKVPNIYPMQTIEYLPQINSSPTSHSVVALTLKMALQLADECDQKYLLVTYDLAICKIAMAIQVVERNHFDRLFIMLGIIIFARLN